MKPRLGIRWTVGDVSPWGFSALGLSVRGAHRLYGDAALYRVVVNGMAPEEAARRVGPVPPGVAFEAARDLPAFLRRALDAGMAEGVAWKFAPLRVFPTLHELALDNDCILWDEPAGLRAWREAPAAALLAEDVRPASGRFGPLLGPLARHSGIRGLPPGFDLGAAFEAALAEAPGPLATELDEQGLQIFALLRALPVHVVTLDEVAICSPFPPHRPGPGRSDAWVRAHEAVRATLAAALARERVDVVHLHGLDFAHYLPPPGPPVLATLHLPADRYRTEALRPERPRTYLHCVSRVQRAAMPAGAALLDDVENGVDLARFRPGPRPRGYALALGRICEPKGSDLALEAAARAGVPLVLAGGVHHFPEHLRWFDEVVRPRLGPRARFAGPVAGDRKRRLLAGASCVVVASRAAETCSLVALEALASGTPVVALRRGALPDVVRQGVTGFLADDVDGLAEGIRRARALDRRACRADAEERFPIERTVGKYLALYEQLAGE